MAYPPRYLRHTNFLALLQAGGAFDQNFAAYLDAELNDIVSSIDQEISRWQAITTASAQLINNASALAMALAGSQRFVATAAQTVYTTTIPWDASFTSQTVLVNRIAVGSTQGGVLDWNGITVADSGSGFLKVTITSGPTISSGDIILIDAFSPGAGVLANLASLANGKGASLVGIEDVAGYFAATTVEGALAEFKLAYNTFVTSLGTTANIWYKNGKLADGTTATAATADWAMGSHKLTGLADGVANTDAVTVQQLNAATQGLLALTSFFLRKDVAVPWESDQSANSHKLTGLKMTDTLGATASEAANQTYVTGYVAAQLASINSQLAALGNPSAAGKRLATFLSPGSGGGFSFTAASGVTAAVVEIWGGGGGSNTALDAGQSGAYTQVSLSLVVGDVVSFAVGAGGAGTGAGNNGQDTVCYVNGTEVARAGGGPKNVGSARAVGTIAVSSKVTGGFTMAGDHGTSNLSGGSPVTSGGAAPRGGRGGTGFPSYSDLNGQAPGGGSCPGGNGGGGWAIITY